MVEIKVSASKPPRARGMMQARLVVARIEDMPWKVRRLRRRTLPGDLAQGGVATAQHGSWLVVVRRGWRTLGFAWAVPILWDRTEAYIEEIAVHPRRQSLGLGSGLVEELARWLKIQGFTRVRICSFEDEHRARREAWFQRLGFRKDQIGYWAPPAEILASRRAIDR
jgi:GNAT superfamily N-acetyltransferase